MTEELLYPVIVIKSCSIHFPKDTVCFLGFTSDGHDFKLIKIDDEKEIVSCFSDFYFSHIKFL